MRLTLTLALAAVVAATAVLVAGTAGAPAASAAFSVPNLNTLPVSGTTSDGGTFTGTANIDRFGFQNGQLMAIGTLTGTVENAAGSTVAPVTNQAVSLPVSTGGTGGCQIADLTLGPLHLDLLGLVVQLDTVHLNITAQPGAGNLLGNLLCMLTNLLNNSSSSTALQQVVSPINRAVALQ